MKAPSGNSAVLHIRVTSQTHRAPSFSPICPCRTARDQQQSLHCGSLFHSNRCLPPQCTSRALHSLRAFTNRSELTRLNLTASRHFFAQIHNYETILLHTCPQYLCLLYFQYKFRVQHRPITSFIPLHNNDSRMNPALITYPSLPFHDIAHQFVHGFSISKQLQNSGLAPSKG